MLRRPPSISGQELALAVESGSWNTSGESNMSAGKVSRNSILFSF